MTQVIVHAGFHKTGTSSLQDYLRKIRHRLPEGIAVHLKEDFLDAGNLARRYGQRPYPWRRRRFARALRRYLAEIDDSPVHILSWEGFSGIMPGHRRATGPVRNIHRAAIPLARTIVRELRRRFGPDTEITFLYTLREPESWLRSVHGHLLRSIRLTEDFDAFRAGFTPPIRLDDEATRIARAIAPVPVATAWLEDVSARPEGPAAALLDLLDLPADFHAGLPAARKTNTGNSAAIRAQCLALNLSLRDARELKRRKDELTGFNRPASR
jgi:Sulfotransferase domain